MSLNERVRAYWEREPCGTNQELTGRTEKFSLAWFQNVEEHRYSVEPIIHAVAQFTRWRGKRILEIGVGAGTDHLQWARASADCHGVDLTDAAIETTRRHLAHYGFLSRLQRVDAETLPFDNQCFDLVYSWGVLHHAEHPERIVAEIHRVLRPGGVFVGMIYGRHSLTAYKAWARFALLRLRPWRSLSRVVWEHVESVGTKAYTLKEARNLFGQFQSVSASKMVTYYDTRRLPRHFANIVPNALGWFITLRCMK
jgi:ubiquinone/menaquinone biosynthesis C-methylase UbiE